MKTDEERIDSWIDENFSDLTKAEKSDIWSFFNFMYDEYNWRTAEMKTLKKYDSRRKKS